MKYNYQYKYTLRLNEPFNVEYICDLCRKYANSTMLIEVQNTKGITSRMISMLPDNVLIRVAGGYDENRLNRYGKDITWDNYYYDSVIYSKNEMINILRELERIEYRINPKWSDIQKVVYIYDSLKRRVMYDPAYKVKSSSEIRSLRGLMTKKTVCAGYSLMFKEFMDRNNIECEYVEGFISPDKTGPHAWNIITLNGRKYGVDITQDNAYFRAGDFNTFECLGQSASIFSNSHYPFKGEKTQNYIGSLSELPKGLIKGIYSKIDLDRTRNYRSSTVVIKRNDNSRYLLSQLGSINVNGVRYFRYYYADVDSNNNIGLPVILYSDTNVISIVNKIRFKRSDSIEYRKAVFDVLFSRKNINDSIKKGSYYIGGIYNNDMANIKLPLASYRGIKKPTDVINFFKKSEKRFKRSDGSSFIVEQMQSEPLNIHINQDGKHYIVKVMPYDILELINDNGSISLIKNTVYTEKNFLKDNRQSVQDNYLSRKRINKASIESGSYIGYYDENERVQMDSHIEKHFKTTVVIDYNVDKDSINKYQNFPLTEDANLKR